ncbi:hypothetical protein [Kineothrix sedimenti]|uniref:HEAT repeat protein n=1 Tax=Kineothrix sedimenti TaxID=3123317 RepID=A0ABZ3EWX5_9FIRM
MRWSDYYEKINDWAVSTAVNKISSLEDMGAPDEIVDALNIIAFEDEKGATRLLNRAVQYGVKFSGENLAEIAGLCAEDSFKKALYQSAEAFTAQDLEDLYCCVDDELIVELAKRYKISAPADIAEEYEEELCPDAGTPISWSRFYDAFYDWKPEYAKARLQSVTDFGSGDEVLEVVQELFWDDEYEASRLIMRALDAGVRFKDENIVELTSHCNEDTIKQVVFLSRLLLTEESLEELYGNVSDDIIIEVAKEQNLRLPEDLREEEEEPGDISYEVHAAIDAADYALECLAYAQQAMNDSGSASVLDMLTTGFLTSFLKQATLSEADAEVRQAQMALNDLNAELRELSKNKTVQLKYARLATAIDLWFDDGFLDALTHLQINKAQKRISKAITQVKNIKRELRKLL